jgi:hypothetical protein
MEIIGPGAAGAPGPAIMPDDWLGLGYATPVGSTLSSASMILAQRA